MVVTAYRGDRHTLWQQPVTSQSFTNLRNAPIGEERQDHLGAASIPKFLDDQKGTLNARLRAKLTGQRLDVERLTHTGAQLIGSGESLLFGLRHRGPGRLAGHPLLIVKRIDMTAPMLQKVADQVTAVLDEGGIGSHRGIDARDARLVAALQEHPACCETSRRMARFVCG